MNKIFFYTIIRGSIVKNLSILVSGTAVAQLLVIGFQVVIRRIYSPADFGAFAVYMSILGIVATLSSLRYEQAIVLPKEYRAGKGLLKLSVIVSVITSVLLALVIVAFRDAIAHGLNFPKDYRNWLYVLPLSILLFSIYQALNLYLIRTRNYKLSATNKIIRRITEGSTQFIFGKFKLPVGLFIGDLLGQFAMILTA